jgi:mxaJ protein
MFFRCLSLLLAVLPVSAAEAGVIRVCAEPNNLPFSNQREEGFENRIARVLAADLGVKLEFVWWSGRKGLVKHALDEDRCDVLMGIPAGVDSAVLTHPYYRSSYVFVSRQDRALRLVSLNDSRLTHWRIGIQMVGDDFAPPAAALAHRGISSNVVGYSLFGEYGKANPAARAIDGVAAGDVDVAIVWGPLAGYFASHSSTPLTVTPVSPAAYLAVPFVYSMTMGVRKGNDALLAALNSALDRNCAAVKSILQEFHIPQAAGGEGGSSCDASRRSPAAALR